MILSESHDLIITTVVLVVGYVLFSCLKSLYLYKSVELPGPPTLPFFGNALCFMGNTQDILKTITRQMESYSSLYRIWLGRKILYVIYEPEQLKTVLLSPNMIEKNDFYNFIVPWVGTGLLTAPAAKWRVHRKIISPTFNRRILQSFVKIFSTKSNIMVKQMEIEMNGKEFGVFPYVSLCGIDILCESVLGVPSNDQTEKHSDYITAAKEILQILGNRILKIWLHPDIIFYNTKAGKKMLDCIKCLHVHTRNIMRQKKEVLNHNRSNHPSPMNGTSKAFLDLLMELSEDENMFTNEELQEEIDVMMVAGQETTATTNCFVMLMLASHPEIQEKVYEELFEIYGSVDPCESPIKHEDLHKMKYLGRVIKETMRILPVVPIIYRRATEDLKIGDYTLPRGSSVALAIVGTHRSEKYWQDPLKFDPDRFLPEECDKRHPYAYIPFSGGPRNCIGLKYAMMVMKTLIGTVVRKYILKKDKIIPIQDIELKMNIALETVEPITIRIEKRIPGKHTDDQ